MSQTNEEPASPMSPNVAINGRAIRARRIELGDNLVMFALKVPMSIGYLSQLERGKRTRVSPRNFQRLAKALQLADRPDDIKAA